MLRLLKKLRRNERGNVLILAALCMPLIVGSTGLAVDTIQWALWKRQLQRAADSAALAGVYATVQGASQTSQQAAALSLQKFQTTGLTLDTGSPSYPTPQAGTWTNAFRVRLQVTQVPAFSSMFLPSIAIPAEATAATIATGVYCVVSLVETAETGIRASGSSNINMGCGMITNSTSMTAAIATGNSSVRATPIAAVGAITQSTNWNNAELLPFTVKQNDPYAGVGVPSFSAANCIDLPNHPNGVVDRTALDTPATLASTGGVRCLNSLEVQGTVKLGSATYVINGGNFTANATAKLSCTGCTIILTNADSSSTATIGTVSMNGGAEINMTAPNSGPYDGILIYQDRRATTGSTNNINGNSTSTMSGALYFPKQEIEINGGSGLTFSCAQFVARTVDFSGNGTAVNTCTAGYGTRAIMGRHVRLVA